MTIDQYANLAQIVAAIGVIASLVYVAIQLRQNTAAMRAGASADRVLSDAGLNFKIADNAEFTAIWLKGRSDFYSLDEVERIRLIFFNRPAIVHWHNMFDLHAQNLLPEEDWNEVAWLIRHLAAPRQDAREAWKIFRDSFDEPFRKFLDAQFAAAAPTP
jgi:hypothetical protein